MLLDLDSVERLIPDEDRVIQTIADTMVPFVQQRYPPGVRPFRRDHTVRSAVSIGRAASRTKPFRACGTR